MISKKQIFSRLLAIALVLSGCGVQIEKATATATSLILTSTLPPTLTAPATMSPLPPLPRDQPTVAPVEGTSATQINVRSDPSTAATVLGIIPPNTKVQIIGKDPAGNWWQILYPEGSGGKGWVTAQYVTTVDTPQVPVVGGNTVDPNNPNVAIVQQQINIRSGPGTSFNSLGTLNPQDVISLTGKDAYGAWLQIAFTSGPDGKGWVNAAFVQAQGVENLPIITEAGEVAGTGTPTGIPPTVTPTIIPAWADNDSLNNPIASVTFEPNGIRSFIYSDDISSPDGDLQDWVQFVPDSQAVWISLECRGTSELKVNLSVNSLVVTANLGCGDRMQQISVNAGSSYVLHLEMPQSSGELRYAGYTLTVQASQ